MEEWAGSCPYTEEKKDNLYQKISKLNWKTLHKNMEFANPDMIKVMIKAQRGFKKINLVKKRSEIEMERYEHSSEPGNLKQDKQLSAFYFFVTMLGYIDSNINDERENIRFNSLFMRAGDNSPNKELYDKIKESETRIQKFLEDRKEVLNDYISVMGDNGISGKVKSVLNEIPSSNKFGELYKDSRYVDYEIKLVSAYNIGFFDIYGNYEEKMKKYRALYNDLLIYINYSNAELEYEKNKIKRK